MPRGIYPRKPLDPNTTCARCGKAFYVKPSKLARGRGQFCSRRCWKPYEGRPAIEWFPDMLVREGSCLVWTGARDRGGYGQLPHRVDGFIKAHRYAYFQAYGVDPGEWRVCHTCDNPPCCRPEHLFLGTDADNLADMRAKGRGFTPFPMYGEDNPFAKLTEADIIEICRKHAAALGTKYARRGSNGTITALAREFGVVPSVIARVVRGESWAHVSQPVPPPGLFETRSTVS